MERTFYRTTWYQMDALVLESDRIRTVVVPEMGAKIVSLVDKKKNTEWLIGPGKIPFQAVPYGAPFTEQDMSGWDEMFPSIVACEYPGKGKHHGVPIPDHGEVWTLPWTHDPENRAQLELSVSGKALPYRLTRKMSFPAPDTLKLTYELINQGSAPMPYLWAAHPQFLCGQKTQIVLPEQVQEVCNTLPAEWGWGEPETRFDWPEARDPDKRPQRIDQVGPPTLEKAWKFFTLPDERISQATLIRKPSNDYLRLTWDPNEIPYFGIWVDQGVFSHASVAAPEPSTGYYDSLETAWQKGEVTLAKPGEPCIWSLSVQLGTTTKP